jgi:uncharacterized protein (DUF2235 family)
MTTPKVGKRLIISCDGTWQSADTGTGKEPTNAINFCRALAQKDRNDGMDQIIFYQPGVGTGGVLRLQSLLAGMI